MTVEVVWGETRRRTEAGEVARVISATSDEGTLYIGYPVIGTGDESIEVDGLYLSRDHGFVALSFGSTPPVGPEEWALHEDKQAELFLALQTYLGRHPGLRRGRRLGVSVETVTVFPILLDRPDDLDGNFVDLTELAQLLAGFTPLSDDLYTAAQAAVQRVSTIKPRKRRTEVARTNSRGAIMKQIEREIANLDQWQKRAAIETPEGPQRIRGLAGSGKTVVLALKAAYLYAQNPHWNIALTFQTRALYQQIVDLVRRFAYDSINDEPDDDHLKVMHAWGSSSRDGMYSLMARSLGLLPRDFNYARATYGMDDAFAGICRELLEAARQRNVVPLFDAVLIDEAQDLPPEFFQLVRIFTRPPGRVTWAYDELQKLSEASMPDTGELFGLDLAGDPLVRLENVDGEARQDIVLPVCYRNTPWALTSAHALGLGIYRNSGPVQQFDDPQLWVDVGYEELSGELIQGHPVTLRRRRSSYPNYFTELLTARDAVQFHNFETEVAQDAWVASAIKENLDNDELQHDDILIVLPDVYTAKRRAPRLARQLEAIGIQSHLVGVASSVDEVFIPNSVAISHIYRAKGNEAPMVYVVDADWSARGPNLITKRNVLFTAMTRSRAWVRITGSGPAMTELMQEASEIAAHDFTLAFTVPTADQLRTMRRLNRDRSREETARAEQVAAGFANVVEALDRDELSLGDLPAEAIAKLFARIQRERG